MKDVIKWLKAVFISELVLCLFLLVFLFTPLNELYPTAPLIIFIIFFPLGLIQFFLTKKNIEDKRLKIILMINGLSSSGILFFSVIHNAFYALGQLSNGVILVNLLGFLEGAFFVIAMFVCPVIFLITVVLTIIFYKKTYSK